MTVKGCFSLDTNILVHAVDRDAGERHGRSVELVGRAARQDCVLATQALAEFFHATTRKNLLQPTRAEAFVRNWLDVVDVVSAAATTLVDAMTVVEEHRLSFGDYILKCHFLLTPAPETLYKSAKGDGNMKHKGPGKANREGISLKKLMRMFPDDDKARQWFEARIWPQGPYCPHCGSFNVQCGITHKSMTHRCRECEGKPRFSVKTGTVMQSSKLGYQTWAIALYLVTAGLKGVSSMKLHRDLEITQKSAWHLAHRLRKALEVGDAQLFLGPAEADETHIGGKRKNMSNRKRKEQADTGRGTVGKAAVAGVQDRETNQVAARRMGATDASALQTFVREHVEPGATLYTDEAAAYRGMPEFEHEAVNHSTKEFVRGMASTNGMESFWSMLKRGYQGTFHHFSEKHLDRYVTEFAGRHNVREADTVEQMGVIAARTVGKRLRYKDLTA